MKTLGCVIKMTDQTPSAKAIYLREYRLKKKLAKEAEDKKLTLAQAKDEKNWNKIKALEAKEESLGREVLVDDDDLDSSCRDNQPLSDWIKDQSKIIDNYKQFESDGNSYMHSDFWSQEDSSSQNKNRISHQANLKRLFGDNRCESE
jgi:hypothetical protein